jgi:hypothetical protein
MPVVYRRSGSPDSLWKNATVGVNGKSTAVLLSRATDQLAVYITVSAATTVTLEVAHHGALTPEGNEPNQASPPASWFTCYYVNTAVQIAFASAGSAAIIVPDFEPAWIRLSSSAAATITAGHEVTGG